MSTATTPAGLPDYCYSIGPKTRAPVLNYRWDSTLYGVRLRQSAIYKVFALPFFGWLRNILPLADESIKKWEARQ